MEKKRRYFPDEIRRQATERLEISGLSITDVAAELGVDETQLGRWMQHLAGRGRVLHGPPHTTEAQGPSPTWRRRTPG